VSLLLDLLIRQRHDNQRSLDDVMRQMWQQFGKPEIGFRPEQLQSVLESVAGMDLADFYQRYIDGTEELPFNSYLEPFGLKLQAELQPEDGPYLGLNVKSEPGGAVIKFVEANSPAQQAGIDAGDELLAIAGFRVSAEQLSDRLKDYQPGDSIQITVFHRDELRTCTASLAEPIPSRYQICPLEHPSAVQQANFKGWLGGDLTSIK
jgi:predicted metalloprotease with PDZ domain